MKKINFLVAICFVIMFLFGFNSNLKAQDIPPPCVPDCEYTPFGPTVYNDFYFDNFCIIRVWYTWRIACDNYYDVQIVKIQTVNPYCNEYTNRQLFESAFKKIIQLNRMGYPPAYGGCNVNWRITTASCWAFWTIIVFGQELKVMLPCTGTGCCYQPYRVCRDEFGNVTLTPLGNPWPAVDCIDAIPPSPPPGLTCFPICDWIYFTQLPGIIKPNDEGHSPVGNILKVEQMQEDETLQLIFQTVKKVNFSVRITDVYGIQLIEKSGVVDDPFDPVNISTSELNSGNYLYNVYIDGILLYSGKLSKTK